MGYSKGKFRYRVQPHDDNIKPFRFTVKNAIYQKDATLTGKSPAQGNPNAQPYFSDHIWVYFRNKMFLDPSYGKVYIKEDATLKRYCEDNISSVLVENRHYQEVTDYATFKGFIAYDDLERYLVCDKEKPTKM